MKINKLVCLCSTVLLGSPILTTTTVIAESIDENGWNQMTPPVGGQTEPNTLLESKVNIPTEGTTQTLMDPLSSSETPSAKETTEELPKGENLETSSSSVSETGEEETSTSSTDNKEEANESNSSTEEAVVPSDSAETVSSEEKTKTATAAEATTLGWKITVSGTDAEIEGYVGSDVDRVIPTLEDLQAADPATYGSCTQVVIRNNILGNAAVGATSLSISTNGSKVKMKDTSLASAFSHTGGIKSINLNNLDTSNVTDMSRMFFDCSGLTNVDVSNLDTSNVTSMSNMFYLCSSLTSLDVSNFNTSNVTNMSRMFSQCSKLTSLDVSKFDTSNVTDMSYMFSWCKNLTNLDVSNFNTSNVTNMSYMFSVCKGLTSLDVSKFDTSNVTDMSYMFGNDMYGDGLTLTNLDVSNFDTSNVTNMSYMFARFSSLTSLDVSKFDTSNVTDMTWMFEGCSDLTNLDVSNFNTSNVTNMSYMFYLCSSLTSLDVSDFNTSNVTNMNGMFGSCPGLISLDVSNFDTSKVTDMSEMFSQCSSLTNLDVSKFDTSNVTDMSWMFSQCSSLTNLDVSNFNTLNVTNMVIMFSGCSGLTSLDLSNFNTSNVTSMSNMFYQCSKLTSLDLSNFNTSNVTNMSYMFSQCSKLTSLDLSSFDMSNVTNMNGMFYWQYYSSTTYPLLIKIDKSNTKLLNYNYSSDNRVPAGPNLDPNGGSFSGGTTQTKSYLEKVALTTEEYAEKEKLDNFKKFIQDNTPTKSGVRFGGWQDAQGNTPDQVTNPLDQLTTTYMAQWKQDPNVPQGSVKPLPNSQELLSLYYLPTQFSIPTTQLNQTGEQIIPFDNGNNFHVGIKDIQSGTSWQLNAQLVWNTPGLETSYIQTKNTTGQVNENQNDGQTDVKDTDFQITTDVVGEKDVIISETETTIMKSDQTNLNGFYDYALGQADLVIPDAKMIQPNNYKGTVNWNLIQAP
ncbi:BspA family leucine-rich repeat surface protein [Enterococcus faecium]|uniref:BspA family leucine-rich repeat surface protein n=1 Tax=Enterococcus faecium TaxID=1352 RepID=UPI00223B8FA3|nr:BspA family leucine-rich repeat surface protein [Enterococcus faecium]